MKSSTRWLIFVSTAWLIAIVGCIGVVSDTQPVSAKSALFFLLLIAVTIEAAYSAGRDSTHD